MLNVFKIDTNSFEKEEYKKHKSLNDTNLLKKSIVQLYLKISEFYFKTLHFLALHN